MESVFFHMYLCLDSIGGRNYVAVKFTDVGRNALSDDHGNSSQKKASLEDLDARVKAARKAIDKEPSGEMKGAGAYGMAMRLVGDLVSGLLVGFLIGFWLDKWLGTKPWFLIVFIFLGLGAGIFNVMRSAKQLTAKVEQDNKDKG